MSIAESLGFKKRIHVGISVSANNTVELVCINKSEKSVAKYAQGNVKYNSAIREIIDFEEFSETIEGLFEDAGLNPSECCVTLNLPNVHFGITPMGSSSESVYIIENLQTEIEDLYIFKRNEPIISYSMLPSAAGQKNIVYGAIQSKVVVKLIEIFDKLDIELVRIDNAYSSILKALKFCDRFNKFFMPDEKTAVLLITPNSFCSMLLEGDIIVETKEEPLAVKSFSSEEVYSAVSGYALSAIDNYSPQSLIVISETDDINSELLGEKINFAGETDFVNKDRNEFILDVSEINSSDDENESYSLTLEAIGAAVADFDEYSLNINFLPEERINKNLIQAGEYEVDYIRFAIEVFLIAIISALIFGLSVAAYFNSQKEKNSESSRNISNQIKVFKDRVQGKDQFVSQKNVFPVMKALADNNQFVTDAYIGLSTEIPDSVYIKKFITNSNGGIGILGESKSSEAVESFVNRLKEKNVELMVSKLSINSGSDASVKIPNGFTFEIKTSGTDIDFSDDSLYSQNSVPDNIRSQSGAVSPARKRNLVNVTPVGGQSSDYTPPPAPVI